MEKELKHDAQRDAVRKNYATVAKFSAGGCCPSPSAEAVSGCCAPHPLASADAVAKAIGYSEEELKDLPEGANMGLGCGNPQTIASLRKGETVLDLGAGGGFDAFIAARAVGPSGKVIGVDMTPEMVSKARKNAASVGLPNVEFRLGEIEHLPVADNAADVIISNCVINLSPAKEEVFREAFRVLKPGGRLAISDVVALKPMPGEIRDDIELLSGCVSGAALVEDVRKALAAAGFSEIEVEPKNMRDVIRSWAPGRGIEDYVTSADIRGVKPQGG